MKIVIVKMIKEEWGLCSGKYSGTAKLLSSIDDRLVEEDLIFESTSASFPIPFSGFTYTVHIRCGILGRKLLHIRNKGQNVPLHEVVITNSANSFMIFDEHSN